MQIPQEDWLYDNEAYFVIVDKYPVTVGHLLVVSKRVATDYFELDDDERRLLSDAILNARQIIDARYEVDRRPDGYNIGMNCGEAAGQTVMHFHCHVIPRQGGDSDDPTGGVRKCVNGFGRY